MNIKQLEDRLDRLRPRRIVLLTRMPDGTQREMTAPEYVEAAKDGTEFIRVIRGDDLHDLDMILSTIHTVTD